MHCLSSAPLLLVSVSIKPCLVAKVTISEKRSSYKDVPNSFKAIPRNRIMSPLSTINLFYVVSVMDTNNLIIGLWHLEMVTLEERPHKEVLLMNIFHSSININFHRRSTYPYHFKSALTQIISKVYSCAYPTDFWRHLVYCCKITNPNHNPNPNPNWPFLNKYCFELRDTSQEICKYAMPPK